MSAEQPETENTNGAENSVLNLADYDEVGEIKQTITTKSETENGGESFFATVKAEDNEGFDFQSAEFGGTQRNNFNVSFGETNNGEFHEQFLGVEDGVYQGANGYNGEEIDSDDELTKEDGTMRLRATGDYWSKMATYDYFETEMETQLRELLMNHWFVTDSFELILELFRPLLQLYATETKIMLREQRWSFEEAFTELFPNLDHSATALLAWFLTMDEYEPWTENIITAEFRRRFSAFKKLPKPQKLVQDTQRLAWRNIVLRYLEQTDFSNAENPGVEQPESGDDEGNQAASTPADPLSFCKPVSVTLERLKDTEPTQVVSTVSLLKSRKTRKNRASFTVADLGLGSGEEITNLDDTNTSTPIKNGRSRSSVGSAKKSSSKKERKRSLHRTPETEPAFDSDLVLEEIKEQLKGKVILVPPRRESGAQGKPQITDSVSLRPAFARDKKTGQWKPSFSKEKAATVLAEAEAFIKAKIPWMKVSIPKYAVKPEPVDPDDNEPLKRKPATETESSDIEADDSTIEQRERTPPVRNRAKKPKSTDEPLKMTIKAEAFSPVTSHRQLRSGASKGEKLSESFTSAASDSETEERRTYEDALEDAGDRAFLYYKHAKPLKLQDHLFDNDLSKRQIVNRGLLYPFLTSDQRLVPEFPKKIASPTPPKASPTGSDVREPKDISAISVFDFDAIPFLQLSSVTGSQLSIPNVNFQCQSLSYSEWHEAGERFAVILDARRAEIGGFELYGHSEPFGAPVDQQKKYLQMTDALDAVFPDKEGTTAKWLPPGCEIAPGITLPMDLNEGLFVGDCLQTGCGHFSLSEKGLKAVSKIYDIDANLLQRRPAKGWRLVRNNYKATTFGWEILSTKRTHISAEELNELQLGLLKTRPLFKVSKNGLSPGQVEAEKLAFVIKSYDLSAETPYLWADQPGCLIQPEQKEIILDYSNSKSAAKYLKINDPSRRNLRTFSAISPHTTSEWVFARSGFNVNILVHSGEHVAFCLHRRDVQKLVDLMMEETAEDEDRLCPCFLFHENLKIDVRYIVSRGIRLSYAVLGSGSLLSVGINGGCMLYSLSDGVAEISQSLSAEGLLYLGKSMPSCICEDNGDGEDTTMEECKGFNDRMKEALYAMLWPPGPMVSPPYLCGLHSDKITSEGKFEEHMAKKHLPQATRDKTGAKW